MGIPTRCNRRACQARRTLKQRPEAYVEWPKCHKCGEGLMYVDEYRLQGREVENNPTCTDPYCTWQADHLERTGNLVPFHGVANVGCSGYEEYKINSAVKASKHRPHKDDSPTEEAPF